MARTFVISDNHFSDYDGPGNIIDFFRRPFPDPEAMNGAMVRNWNRVVRPQDTVYSLGDFAWTKEEMDKYARRLNGTIHFILGNHDFEGDRAWKKQPPHENADYPLITILTYRKQDFLLVHRPGDIPRWWEGWAIHGHHHWMLPRFPFIDGKNRNINVSCELAGYTPVDLDWILSLGIDRVKTMDTTTSEPVYWRKDHATGRFRGRARSRTSPGYEADPSWPGTAPRWQPLR
jgi:calcineurin-like phosphoesterase family protein